MVEKSLYIVLLGEHLIFDMKHTLLIEVYLRSGFEFKSQPGHLDSFFELIFLINYKEQV